MFDFAVIVPTILRPKLVQACESIFNQSIDAKINIVIGIDFAAGDKRIIDDIKKRAPDKCQVTVIDLGYSTAKARGGIFSNRYGGAIRTICSFAGNAKYLAYLDDDNWLAPNHLEELAGAIGGKSWAFTRRYYTDPKTRLALAEDIWESVGPGQGVYQDAQGGFCDTGSLLLDTEKNIGTLAIWSLAMYPDGSGEDRYVFSMLKEHEFGDTKKPTYYYTLNGTDLDGDVRLRLMAEAGIEIPRPQPFDEILQELHPDISPYESINFDPYPLTIENRDNRQSAVLADILQQLKPRNIIDVGSWKGASASCICNTLAKLEIKSNILCIDTWLGELNHLSSAANQSELLKLNGYPTVYYQFISNIIQQRLTESITPFPTTSRIAAKYLAAREARVDFVYINAAQEEEQFANDLEMYWPLLKRGGVVMGDDYHQVYRPDIIKTVQCFLDKHGLQRIDLGTHNTSQFAIQKI